MLKPRYQPAHDVKTMLFGCC